MELPALLPVVYKRYAAAKFDEELFALLQADVTQCLEFFEYAADDETWSEAHGSFMKMALEWFTELFLHEQITVESAQGIGGSFKKHYPILERYLPKDLSINIQGKSCKVNSLLFAAGSERLREMRRSLFFKNQEAAELKIEGLSYDLFSTIMEFVCTGKIQNLWKCNQEQLIRCLRAAELLELHVLQEECQNSLKKYIDDTNVFDLLQLSHEHFWRTLRGYCCDFINHRQPGAKVAGVERRYLEVGSNEPRSFLSFEFYDFNEPAIELFNKLKAYVTHLVCSGDLIQEQAFSRVTNECPRLVGLDISRSGSYSDRLTNVPPHLEELDISKCPWLTPLHFTKIVSQFPALKRLVVSGNTQLTYRVWPDLHKLADLRSLDVSRCDQLNDDAFILLLKSSPRLRELVLEGCTHISEQGFFQLAHLLAEVLVLDISRCHIHDGALLEIVVRCKELHTLALNRCDGVSDKGLMQVAQHGKRLRVLFVAGCNFSEETILHIRERYPYLSILNVQSGYFFG